MRYGSVCSGIEAATVAWHPLGWEPEFFAEIEPFPSAVLAHHYPNTPNLGDFTKIGGHHAPIDVLVGGTPCQSFSVAGRRLGLDDPRGNLALEFLALARRLRPRWVVFENVPGLLSSDGGRDFGTFLGGLGECGYGFAYRILDAQYVRVECHPRAVPQRRRRLFVVGYLGDWRPAAAVLLEPESLRGDPAPRRQAGAGIADGAISRALSRVGGGDDPGANKGAPIITTGLDDGHVARALNGCHTAAGRHDISGDTFVAHSPKADGFDASEDGTGRGTPLVADPLSANEQKTYTHEGSIFRLRNVVPVQSVQAMREKKQNGLGIGDDGDEMFTLTSRDQHAVALAIRGRPDGLQLEINDDGAANAVLTPNGGRGGIGVGAVAIAQNQRGELRTSDAALQLTKGGGKRGQGYPAARIGTAVRRLTPRECERLQGFPDDYTLVRYRGKPAADGPRYKALGNSMAVNCMRWIGERIALFERVVR